MSVARVKKIQLLAHSEAHMDLLASLQEEGFLHIEKTDVEDGGLEAPVQDVTELDHWLYKLYQAIAFLSPWQEKSLGDKLSGRKPEVNAAQRDKTLDFDFQQALEEVGKLESDRSTFSRPWKRSESSNPIALPSWGGFVSSSKSARAWCPWSR